MKTPFEALDIEDVKKITVETINSLLDNLGDEFGTIFEGQQQKFEDYMARFYALKGVIE